MPGGQCLPVGVSPATILPRGAWAMAGFLSAVSCVAEMRPELLLKLALTAKDYPVGLYHVRTRRVEECVILFDIYPTMNGCPVFCASGARSLFPRMA